MSAVSTTETAVIIICFNALKNIPFIERITVTMKPFIKWAGGKTKLLSQLMEYVPKTYSRYIEPFAGGGAMLLGMNPHNASVNDINPVLTDCYRFIRDDCESFLSLLSELEEKFNKYDCDDSKKEFYYDIRDKYNASMPSIQKSAMFMFLNKTCFNGLYRENSRGEFNVPFGKKKKIQIYDRENLNEISKFLKGVEIYCMDFENFIRNLNIGDGDFVFVDSPYADTYDAYNKSGFTPSDHERLACLLSELSERGAYCLATNSACDFIRDLYPGWEIREATVMHAINRNGDDRMATEIIMQNPCLSRLNQHH